MKIKRRHGHGAEVPTHSLNDIMFFLLLFFLIMSTLVNPNVIKILIASTQSAKSIEKPKSYELVVNAEKEYFYNNVKVEETELIKILKNDAIRDNKMLLGVKFDESIDIQELVDVLSNCKENNIKYVLRNMQ